MFKHELGQVVQVTISGEEGHVKARAEYHNGPNQYLIHYLTAGETAIFQSSFTSDCRNIKQRCLWLISRI